MTTFARLVAMSAWTAFTVFSVTATADYEGPSGYGASTPSHELEVSHDGYPSGDASTDGQVQVSTEAPDYVVIEVDDGVSQKVDGETVIVVQEPDPVAATDVAPPAPRAAAVEQPVALCPGGIWVDGYWTYGDGQYVWVEGHCVVERVNYVFVHPRWDFYSNVWWFVPGYYRPCSVWVGFGYYRPWHWYPPYYHPYYRSYRGVPVHRGVPRRPTTARPAPPAARRGVVPTGRRPSVARTSHGRTPTVSRAPTRTTVVNRAPPTRTGSVERVPPTRTGSVARVPPTRTGSVTRVPPTRTGSVTRVPPTRTGSVTRVPPTRTGSVTRVPPSRAGTVVRAPAPSRASVVDRTPNTTTRTPSVRRPSSGSRIGDVGSRPSASPSRTSTVRRPSFGRPSKSGIFRGSGASPSRPSIGPRPNFGRSGGLSRPSSGGFGGARSVPTVRGR